MADQRIQQKIDATLIPGDGIGPDIVASTVDMLAVLGSPFVWDRQQRGLAGIESSGDPLPAAMLDSIRCTRLAGRLVTNGCPATPQACDCRDPAAQSWPCAALAGRRRIGPDNLRRSRHGNEAALVAPGLVARQVGRIGP